MVPLVAIGLFALFRGVLLWMLRGHMDQIARWDIVRCFLVGLRYDGVVVGYGMIPFVLVLTLAPDLVFSRRWFRRGITGFAAAIVTLVLFTEVVGLFFFIQFHARLNWLALNYWGHFHEIAAYIWSNYPVWMLPLTVVAGFLVAYLLFRRVIWSGTGPRGPIWPRPIVATGLIALCILGARGSLGHHRLRFGPAYFTTNKILSQIALNNFFTLGEAIKCYLQEQHGLTDDPRLPPPETASKVVRHMLYQGGDVPLGVEGNPFWRRTETGKPRSDYNVVVVIMEGMAGSPVGGLGNRPSFTPCLDALAEEGLFFERMYGVGDRTCRGLIATFCGHPDLPGRSLIKRPRTQGNFLTLPGVLSRRGYRTLFIFGGNPDFDNMKGFFGAGGIDEFIDEDQMYADDPASGWGTHDEGIFRKAHDVFTRLGHQKFFAIIKTLSNHEPFDVPAGRVELLPPTTGKNKRLNAYRYADWCLGQFFKNARQGEYYKRTIFVLVSDQERKVDPSLIVDVFGYRLPCVIYAPGIVPTRRIRTVCSQTDIAPTVLGLLGGSYEHCFLGRNVLEVEPGDGFAVLRNDDRLAYVWSDRVLLLSPGREPIPHLLGPGKLYDFPPGEDRHEEIERARLRLFSYLRVARQVYINNAYHYPDKR